MENKQLLLIAALHTAGLYFLNRYPDQIFVMFLANLVLLWSYDRLANPPGRNNVNGTDFDDL